MSLALVTAELRDRLDLLNGGDGEHANIRAVFSWSYHQLAPEAARLFRLLGLHPGPDISTPAAASLAGLPAARTGALLDELVQAQLLVERAPGRFQFHDLLRVYAAERAEAEEPAAERAAAIHRMLDHYLHTAHAGALVLFPNRVPLPLAPLAPGVCAEPLTEIGPAFRWFDAELLVLLGINRLANESGMNTHCWQLSWSLTTYFYRRGHWHEWIAAEEAALTAACRAGDRLGQAHTHLYLGHSAAQLGHYDDARTHLNQAMALYTELDDAAGMSHAHRSFSWIVDRQGHPAEAIAHSQRALDLSVVAGHRYGEADALNQLGWCNAQLGRHDQAFPYCTRALALFRELGDRYGEASTLDSLGFALHQGGDYLKAIPYFRQALTLFQELGDRYFEAAILVHLGDSLHRAGEPATDCWQQAVAIFTDLGHRDAESCRARLET